MSILKVNKKSNLRQGQSTMRNKKKKWRTEQKNTQTKSTTFPNIGTENSGYFVEFIVNNFNRSH